MDTWTCQSCGNTNYKDDDTPDICIRCNWNMYGKWDCERFDETARTPEQRPFGWICPVCGNYNAGDFPEYDVCPLCNWEDDHSQRNEPDCPGGANTESLNEYRAKWEKEKCNGDL